MLLAGFLLGCAATELPPLPTEATAEGVTITGTATDGPYTVALAGASGDVRGSVVSATTTTVVGGGGEPLHIAAARSSWNLKARSVRFEGGVVVTRGAVTMRSEALDVQYAAADVLELVIASGGVVVEQGARRATAERAELVGKTGRITLTGHPALAEGVNALVGERIVVWLDDEKADCEGGSSGPCQLTVAGEALGR